LTAAPRVDDDLDAQQMRGWRAANRAAPLGLGASSRRISVFGVDFDDCL
jgi:hypothetical protein